jgi:hypothetical protein
MKSKIQQILQDIESKKQELFTEYEKLREKYDFSFERGRVIFSQKAKKYQK